MPQSLGTYVGTPAPHWITPNFVHPLALPADCFPARDEDSTLGSEVESGSSESSRSGPGEVCPSPTDFKDMSQSPSLCVTYKALVPMTRLFQM